MQLFSAMCPNTLVDIIQIDMMETIATAEQTQLQSQQLHPSAICKQE